jgi:signal transduction histidine kinase
MIDNAINNMRQLIDDLLDLARIESGDKLKFTPVSLASVIEECVKVNLPLANKKAMQIEHTLPGEPPLIHGERARLEQIFNNLIGNAIKYTSPEGHVEIKMESRGQLCGLLLVTTDLESVQKTNPTFLIVSIVSAGQRQTVLKAPGWVWQSSKNWLKPITARSV